MNAEKPLEVLLAVEVVVALHHGDEERLAEPARTDEEDEAVARLHLREVLRLVHVVVPLPAESPEIHDPVRDLKVCALLCHADSIPHFCGVW